MATVQTLKDKDNNTFYPVTKTEAVYNADGSKTLDYILDHTIIASTDPADANKVFKADASLGLVNSNNINWTTFDYTQIRPNFSSSIGSGSFSEGSNYDFTTTQPCYLNYIISTSGASAEYDIVMTSGGTGIVVDAHATGGQAYKFTATRTLFLPKGVSISCRCFGGATGTATIYSILNS